MAKGGTFSHISNTAVMIYVAIQPRDLAIYWLKNGDRIDCLPLVHAHWVKVNQNSLCQQPGVSLYIWDLHVHVRYIAKNTWQVCREVFATFIQTHDITNLRT